MIINQGFLAIRYDKMRLTCAQKLMGSLLNPPH